ncbi:MAG: RHS domain-containing protein [Nitrospirae bacterium]|nr:RHS domain-containing protein [Nitrospirota bacterium]
MKKALRLLSAVLLFIILSTGSVLAGRKIYSYHNAPDGTPLIITDQSGNVVWRADYKPFGEEQSVTGTIENNKRFISKEKDVETGLVYINHRYFEPESGRFLTPDPVGPVNPWNSKTNYEMLLNPQRLNPYAYGLNNPYRYKDPNGMWPEEVHSAIISSAFSDGKYKLSPSAIAALRRGSIEADTPKYQDNAHSYMHAMRAPGQSAEDAAGLTVAFIMQKVGEYKSLMKEGKTDDAYFTLGMAMHPLMDNTSPSHNDYQEWHLIPLIGVAIHKANESVDVFNSNADFSKKSVDAIRSLYNEANR